MTGLPGVNIHCDLYTYSGRYTAYSDMDINFDPTGPYILIYGFDETVPIGSNIKIDFPKILVGNAVGVSAKIGVSILEETPGELEPYVELYYQDLPVFTTLPPIFVAHTTVPSSQPTSILVQTYNQYQISWSPIQSAKISHIMY